MKPVERFPTADEMARLNAVLTRDEFWRPHIVAIVRLLMLTGCRFSDAVPQVRGGRCRSSAARAICRIRISFHHQTA